MFLSRRPRLLSKALRRKELPQKIIIIIIIMVAGNSKNISLAFLAFMYKKLQTQHGRCEKIRSWFQLKACNGQLFMHIMAMNIMQFSTIIQDRWLTNHPLSWNNNTRTHFYTQNKNQNFLCKSQNAWKLWRYGQ